jgi:hypothetical protein
MVVNDEIDRAYEELEGCIFDKKSSGEEDVATDTMEVQGDTAKDTEMKVNETQDHGDEANDAKDTEMEQTVAAAQTSENTTNASTNGQDAVK